jgi:hypothetical protein
VMRGDSHHSVSTFSATEFYLAVAVPAQQQHDPWGQYALEIKKIVGNSGNPHNFYFSDEQLNAIIACLEKYSG